jgi:SAM-dependent methyltransferase
MSDPEVAALPARGETVARTGPPAPTLGDLAGVLACPECGSKLREEAAGPICARDGTRFRWRAGVLDLVSEDSASRLSSSSPTSREAWAGGRPPASLEEAAKLPSAGPASRSLAWRARAVCARSILGRIGGRRLVVADLGAGCGWFSRLLLYEGHRPIALDINADPPAGVGVVPALGHPFSEIAAVRGDIENVPFAPRSLDAAVAFGTLSYLRDPPSWLARIAAVLRPGGSFFAAMVPLHTDPGAAARAGEARTRRMRSDGSSHRYRHFVEGELLEWFRAAGMEPSAIDPPYGQAFLLSRAAKSAILRSEVARFPVVTGRCQH